MLRDVSEYTLEIQPLTLPQQMTGEKCGPGGCRIQDESTAEKPFWTIFLILFVKQRCDWPQTIKKMDSKWLSLATIP